MKDESRKAGVFEQIKKPKTTSMTAKTNCRENLKTRKSPGKTTVSRPRVLAVSSEL
jgi:hypothetical protein